MKRKIAMSIALGLAVVAVLTSLPWIQATYFPYRDKPGMPNIPLLTPLVPGLFVWRLASGYVHHRAVLAAISFLVNSLVYSLAIFVAISIANALPSLRARVEMEN